MTGAGVIAICGAGNLGRRYLEGVLHCERVDAVHVHDITEEALSECQQVVGNFGAGTAERLVAEVFLH